MRQRVLRPERAVDHDGSKGRDNQRSPWSHSDPDADDYEATCRKHLNDSYGSWDNFAEKRKQEEWHKECVNALTHEQDRHRDTRDRMERLEREVQRLSTELNAQNSHDHGSLSLPLSPQTALETFNHGPDSAMWDYDALITKWRTRIQHERSQQHPLPGPSTPWSVTTSDIAQTPSYTDSTNLPTKTFGHHDSHGTNGIDEDEDFVDAPGDEDEMTIETVDSGQGFLDPKLREKVNGNQDTLMANGSPQGKG